MESSISTVAGKSRKEYMREYQRKRYLQDPDKNKQYRNSLRVRLRDDISSELWDKYKHHLADVLKLKELVNKLPEELINEIIMKKELV
jgi:predicted house-cleaning noncanonical NTP pyrophosphatase (MazG superfamily)